MASLAKPGKNYIVQAFIDGKRKTISLRTTEKGKAKERLGIIERLCDCHSQGKRVDPTSRILVSELPAKVQERLAEVGLLGANNATTLSDLCNYILTELGGEPSTITKRKNVKANLVAFFTEDRRLQDILPGDADDFRRWLARAGGRGSKKSLAKATVSRRCAMAKSWFRIAVRKGWISENPFEEQQRESEANPEREFFVDREITTKLLDTCTNASFRLVIALARFGGLRCPSEIAPLEWDWIDWENDVMHIRAQKTKRIEGKAIRVVPIFPELRPYLLEVSENAEVGSKYVIEGISTKTLTDRLHTLCRQAKVSSWEKPWQNMRSTRETELVERFPIHVATAWIGNSPSTANKHYLQVTKEHIAAAVNGDSETATSVSRSSAGV